MGGLVNLTTSPPVPARSARRDLPTFTRRDYSGWWWFLAAIPVVLLSLFFAVTFGSFHA